MTFFQSKTYRAWAKMKNRCRGEDNARWYKELDISFDPRWEKFENFLADMGECPDGLELDRENNDKGYFKENCRWTTHSKNMRNKSTTLLTERSVAQIKAKLMRRPEGVRVGEYDSELGKLYGVSMQTIADIRFRRTWIDVEPEVPHDPSR